jgi:PAB1-binding protein PBP1
MAKKTKAQLEEERLQREEEERKAKIAEEKRLAEEIEKKRLEDIRIQEERRVYREGELIRLREEQQKIFDEQQTRVQTLRAEEEYEVCILTHPSLTLR